MVVVVVVVVVAAAAAVVVVVADASVPIPEGGINKRKKIRS